MRDKKTILLIEDEEDIRNVYASVLNEAGYNVIEGITGDDAITLSTERDWDLMSLDIMIPGIDGVSVLKRVRSTDYGAKLPIIMLTNLDSENLIVECFNSGASGYLIKTEITPNNIISEVKTWLKS